MAFISRAIANIAKKLLSVIEGTLIAIYAFLDTDQNACTDQEKGFVRCRGVVGLCGLATYGYSSKAGACDQVGPSEQLVC